MDTPAPTIRGVNRPKPSEYKKHDSDPVDPSNIRAMTTRERARIQTFPDTFVFPENTANTEQMIGNAVPVQLATFVASSLSDFVDGKQYSCNMQFIDWLKSNKDFEIIVLLGKRLDGEKVDHDIESKHLRQLAEVNTRILYYDQLLANAETLYADFIAQNSSLASLETLINSIE